MTKKEEKKAIKEKLEILAKEPLRARPVTDEKTLEKLRKAGWIK